jgi:hypothetical protein
MFVLCWLACRALPQMVPAPIPDVFNGTRGDAEAAPEPS